MPTVAQIRGEFLRRLDDLIVFLEQRQHRDLDRRQVAMKIEHDSLLTPDLFLVIGVDEKSQGRAIGSGRRLDNEGNDLLLALLIEIVQGPAAELRMLLEIKIRAVGDSFQFAPAHGKKIFDVGGALGIVRQLVFFMFAQANVLFMNAVVRVPSETLVDPPLVPLFVRSRHDEELDLHLLEFAAAKSKISWRNLVTE